MVIEARSRWVQAAVAIAIVLAAGLALYAAYAALTSRGYRFDFGFLGRPAGIEISEGYTFGHADGAFGLFPFSSGDTNAQALLTGLFNTLKIALVAIFVSTGLGVCIALGRMSTNWLLRQLCFLYVEALRNTPLLIQLVFWYFAVILKLPLVSDAVHLYGAFIASRQGVLLPALHWQENTVVALPAAGLCVLLALAVVLLRRRRSLGRGKALGALAALAAVAACVSVRPEFPVVDAFDASGGTRLSPEFAALFLALSVNTSAFIAEAVRGAIAALPRGQWEAAAALGLPKRVIQLDIVMPQVFRVVLPSLGNQYISLAKSTSFGIAIGYPDLFNIYGTVANQTGRTIEGIVLVIGVYIVLSWGISACVNLLNRRLAARGGVQ